MCKGSKNDTEFLEILRYTTPVVVQLMRWLLIHKIVFWKELL